MENKVKYIGIIGKGNKSSFTSRISEAMDDSTVHFLLTDQSGISIFALKYIQKRQFQNYTVYYTGDAPKIKAKNSKKYTSYIEAEEAIRQDSNLIIG